MATFSLQESDVPKLRTQAGRFVAGFGSPILKIESSVQVWGNLANGVHVLDGIDFWLDVAQWLSSEMIFNPEPSASS